MVGDSAISPLKVQIVFFHCNIICALMVRVLSTYVAENYLRCWLVYASAVALYRDCDWLSDAGLISAGCSCSCCSWCSRRHNQQWYCCRYLCRCSCNSSIHYLDLIHEFDAAYSTTTAIISNDQKRTFKLFVSILWRIFWVTSSPTFPFFLTIFKISDKIKSQKSDCVVRMSLFMCALCSQSIVQNAEQRMRQNNILFIAE